VYFFFCAIQGSSHTSFSLCCWYKNSRTLQQHYGRWTGVDSPRIQCKYSIETASHPTEAHGAWLDFSLAMSPPFS
jgi:hypothetical protein